MPIIIRGPVSRSENSLREALGPMLVSDVGLCNRICKHCGALRWGRERTKKNQKDDKDEYSNCCKVGQVMLPIHYFPQPPPPQIITWLLTSPDKRAVTARKRIRDYNNCLSFTSMVVKHDWDVRGQLGIYSYRVNGQLYHYAGSGLPVKDDKPCFAQIYTVGDGGTNEAAMRQKHYNNELDPDLLLKLQAAINERSPYSKLFKSAKDILDVDDKARIVLKSVTPGKRRDLKRYNLPTVEEIGMVVPGDGTIDGNERKVVLNRRDGQLVSINDMHTGYLPMRYVLCFPEGAQQWSDSYKQLLPICKRRLHDEEDQESSKRVSSLQWFAWLLFERSGTFSPLLHCRSLFQELIVDLYLCVERGRLCFFELNQGKMKAGKYKHIISDLDEHREVVGRQVVLPGSFKGGPRNMRSLYQDSIALSRKYGKPSLFLTMTGNPQWEEIQRELKYGETASDRPDIVARVFKMKLTEVMEDITVHNRLGVVASWVYVIEFQKRGLPHAHIVLILAAEYTPTTAEDVDDLVCAEIPDPKEEHLLFQLVTNSMLHGPCGPGFKSPCWNHEYKRCQKRFPKPFQPTTVLQEDAYPLYRRRDNGRQFIKQGFTFTNQHVVPYNRFLLLKYKCHFNVEIAQGIVGYKYIYKYVSKGHDRSHLEMRRAEDLESGVIDGIDDDEVEARAEPTEGGRKKVKGRNEVKDFIDGRYIGPVEAAWRLFQYEMNGRSPGVYALSVHLPDEQDVYFWDDGDAAERVMADDANKTTLTEYLKLNRENAVGCNNVKVRSLLYEEIPDHYSWANKKWTRRTNNRPCATRMSHAGPKEGERFFLRLLLGHVRGATSFLDLRTVNGVIFNTFREAANERDLLESDKHYDYCLKDASFWMTGRALRELFALILVHNSPADPASLWDNHRVSLTDDCLYRMRQNGYEGPLSEDEVFQYGLHLIKTDVEQMGGDWKGLQLTIQDEAAMRTLLNKIDNTSARKEANLRMHRECVITNRPMLNEQQMAIFRHLETCSESGNQTLCYIDGPGGTGKTFVLNTILHLFESKELHTVAVASAGVAAQLLLNGRTAHFAFKIPFKTKPNSVCNLSGRDEFSRTLQNTSLIVWDEISTQHRDCISCVDRSLRHLRKDERPFGGISVIFSGDFRQTLPIVPGGNSNAQFEASIKSTDVWGKLDKFKLDRNVRLLGREGTGNEEAKLYAEWLLRLGSGELQQDDEEMVDLHHVKVNFVSPGVEVDEKVISWLYGDVASLVRRGEWTNLGRYYSQRMLVTPLNKTVRLVNRIVSKQVSGETKIAVAFTIPGWCLLVDERAPTPFEGEREIVRARRRANATRAWCLDTIDEESYEPIGGEYLRNIKFPNFPEHRIELRRGLPVILLRNLNVANGLSNGTRLLITDFEDEVLNCKVISGPREGQEVLIPRIKLIHEPDATLAIKFTRKQFPIATAFCLTINKSQGQSLDMVGVLLPNPVFSHGQLYVALSRCKAVSHMQISLATTYTLPLTKNIVLKRALVN